jgi:hypothetical protein
MLAGPRVEQERGTSSVGVGAVMAEGRAARKRRAAVRRVMLRAF